MKNKSIYACRIHGELSDEQLAKTVKRKNDKIYTDRRCKICKSDRERQWKQANKELVDSNQKKLSEEKRLTLKDSYVRENLIKTGWAPENITGEVIEMKRVIMKTKRLLKDLQNG